jgi:hypothetical protein
MKTTIALTGAVALACLLAPMDASALPAPHKGNPLSKLGISLPKDVGTVWSDGTDPTVVYVGPKDRQQLVGRFANTAGMVDCQDLNNLRSVTWRMPLITQVSQIVKSGESYSPAFDALYGVAARNMNTLDRLIQKKLETADFIEKNKTLYELYITTLTIFEGAENELTQIQMARQAADMKLNGAIVLASSELDPTVRAQLIADARTEFSNEILRLAGVERELQPRLLKARQDFAAAKGKWAPFADRLTQLNTVEQSIQTSYDAIQTLAWNSLERSRNMIKTVETPVVGYASAGYSLFGDEVKQVQDAIGARGVNLKVTRMPNIFDVRTNSSFSLTTAATKGQGYVREINTYEFPADTMLPIGALSMHDLKFKNETSPTTLRFLASDLRDGDSGSGSFDFPVTQGAMCGYATNRKEVLRTDVDGKILEREVNYLSYEAPPPNQAVFAQSIGLQYKTYIEAEPLAATCSLDLTKIDTYYRNAGKRTKWSGFTKSTKTWDDTKRTMIQDMGLKCELTLRPTGATAAEAALAAEGFERAAYDDMFQLFLVSYAKSFTVEPVAKEDVAPAAAKAPGVGAGVMQLCGAVDKRCAFGAVVIKTLEEMGGERYNGTTSSDNRIFGSISRDFRLNSFLVHEGLSSLDLRVCVDASKCD